MSTEEGSEQSYKYGAFISYSRTDRAIAVALQRNLERYILPRAHEILGPGAKSRPFPLVFRDEDDLVPGSDLSKRIRDGLENSEFLIVLCSPAAAQSQWVEREIVGFSALRGEQRILAIVVDGEPNAARDGYPAEMEALPRPLRFIFREGAATDEPGQDPLWIDWRGKLRDDRVNFLRLVAALLDLGSFDELMRRDQQRERAARRLQRRVIVGVSALAILAAVTAFGAFDQRQAALGIQSTYLAENAAGQSDNGDNPTAMILALDALPAGRGVVFPRPTTPIAERALIGAANLNRIRAVFRFNGPVETIRFNPAGSQFVVSSDDGTAAIVDVKTQRVVQRLQLGGKVLFANFDPTGQRVAAASSNSAAAVWDVRTGKRIASLEGHKFAVASIEFSPDGKTLLTSSHDGTDRVWDAATGRPLAVLGTLDSTYRAARFAPDGDSILSCGVDGKLHLWSSKTSKSIRTFDVRLDQLNSFRFSADGKWIVTAQKDNNARIWSTKTGAPTSTVKTEIGVRDAIFNPSGTRVATIPDDEGSDTHPTVWDSATGQRISTLSGHLSSVENAWFSADGSELLTASYDGTARIWDPERGVQLVELGHENGFIVDSAQLSADMRWAALGTADGTVLLGDARVAKPAMMLSGHTGGVNTVVYSADGSRILTASSDKTAIIWDAATGRAVTTLAGHAQSVWAANFSPDGSKVATASRDKTAIIWDARTGARLLTLSGDINAIREIEFSPDGNFVLTASSDWQARVWSASTGKLVKTLQHGQIVTQAHFSPDGRYVVTASDDATSQLWDRVTDKVRVLQHSSNVADAVFSFDGRLVATGAADGSVRIWDTRTAKLLRVLNGHSDAIAVVRFDPSGAYLLSGSNDKSAVLWDVRTGLPVATLPHDDEVNDAQYSRDGTAIATIDQNGTLYIWTNRGALLAQMTRSESDNVRLRFSPDGRDVAVSSRNPTVSIWRVPRPPFAASTATGKALVSAACSAVGDIRGFRNAASSYLAAAHLPAGGAPPCERSGLLSVAYYQSLLCSVGGWSCSGDAGTGKINRSVGRTPARAGRHPSEESRRGR